MHKGRSTPSVFVFHHRVLIWRWSFKASKPISFRFRFAASRSFSDDARCLVRGQACSRYHRISPSSSSLSFRQTRQSFSLPLSYHGSAVATVRFISCLVIGSSTAFQTRQWRRHGFIYAPNRVKSPRSSNSVACLARISARIGCKSHRSLSSPSGRPVRLNVCICTWPGCDGVGITAKTRCRMNGMMEARVTFQCNINTSV